jgi:hypothetical protein
MKEELTTEEMRMIDKMSVQKALAFMHYCADEKLAMVSVKEYHENFDTPRRTIYDKIDKKQLTSDEFCGLTTIIVNDKIL